MKTLLIDMGNTRVKWALLRGAMPGRQHALPISDWRGFEHALRKLQRIASVQVVSVAGTRAELALRAILQRLGLPKPQFLRSTTQLAGVTNGYKDAWRLGADRWVGAISAWHLAGARRAACAVSVGTALTLDVVDAGGQHRGGLIAPGPALMVRSLLQHTQGIAPRAAGSSAAATRKFREATIRPLADNTRDAIELGSLTAAAALIDRTLSAVRTALGARPVVMLTGGGAFVIAPLLVTRHQLCEDLVLQGLAIIARQSAQATAQQSPVRRRS
ncbi:MAG: type III pantothenate kinase [Pseudomonadota bacterium]